ncbi:MAG: hypothetical protein ABR981_02455 [Candidatus Micrarchaeaceae archaeon]|jgi:hypothetical protein
MNLLKSFREIYSLQYLLLNGVIAIAYYFVIHYLLSIQQQGILVTSVPVYLIYLLSLVSSIAFTIAIYSITNTTHNSAKFSATSVSAVTAVAGGILSGCGCQAAILFNVLAISIGTGEATLINTVAAENAPLIFVAMIILNLFVIIYYLEKLSKPMCRVR